ncbi:MAG: hypothetical protein AUH42_01165 [Gemmatimonadetes bacterium 13_1_40CM_70_11]|nr:MAG: hypothetical protein AUH42_01165 [Gemmatimonadetes bacterium 13_1_40CM_70_11]
MSRIDSRVHQVLDGELSREALPAELRPALDRLEAAAALLQTTPARRSVAAWVLAEICRPRPAPLARLARWLTERHAITVRLRPTWSFAVAVLVAAVALVPSHGTEGPILSAQEGIAQFVGRFPGARSVEVVGSFTDWRSGVIPLQDDDHDGVWQTEVVLPAGEHEYMFVVDGERWVPAPLAGRYVDDGFGRQNAIIIVRPGSR